jgi:hypothetical protein
MFIAKVVFLLDRLSIPEKLLFLSPDLHSLPSQKIKVTRGDWRNEGKWGEIRGLGEIESFTKSSLIPKPLGDKNTLEINKILGGATGDALIDRKEEVSARGLVGFPGTVAAVVCPFQARKRTPNLATSKTLQVQAKTISLGQHVFSNVISNFS